MAINSSSGPNLRQIGSAVGYSATTVALALRRSPSIAESTRKVICEAAERMGYKANPIMSHFMSELRRGKRALAFQGTLALVNANRDPNAFYEHPTIPSYVLGCERRAARQGYGFERHWLHDPRLKAGAWLRMLSARGIKGLVLVGLMDANKLPAAMVPIWEALPCVVTGVRTHHPTLPFASVDHHDLVFSAFEKALALGYKRPALIIDEQIDVMLDRRFSAGFASAQEAIARSHRVPVFSLVSQARQSPRAFYRWFDRQRPDVLFTLYNSVFHWLAERNLRTPDDISVVQLEWRASRPDVAGMNQHNDLVGEAAVDMVIAQIRNKETGLSTVPRATLITATWMSGKSVQPRAIKV